MAGHGFGGHDALVGRDLAASDAAAGFQFEGEKRCLVVSTGRKRRRKKPEPNIQSESFWVPRDLIYM